MPVVGNATKMWSRQNSNATLSENFRRMDVAFTEAYQVFTTHDTTEVEVYQAPGLPLVAQSYPGFPFVYAHAMTLDRVTPVFWIVTVEYKGEIGGGGSSGGGGSEPSPLFAPPIIKFDDVETEEEVDVGWHGLPIVNTAGERVRGVKALFSDQILTVTRNFATFNTFVQAVYRRSVNSDTFQGWPPGTVKLMKLSADNVFDVNTYWKVTGVFQFRYPYNTTPDKAWYNRRVSMGLNQRKSREGEDLRKLIPCVDAHKQPATTPQYLDEFGIQTSSDTPYWQTTQLYGELPYNALGLI